jgi:ubiquitin-conjugating enzyme E2 I
MEKHKLEAMTMHLNLMVDTKVSTLKGEFDVKLSAMQKELDDKMLNMYLSNFCRQWMIRKPDALFDFVVYRPIYTPITTLLFGIPGPKRTLWEEGLFPVIIEFQPGNMRPPKVRLPKLFFHLNVFPSGMVCSSLFIEEEQWHPEVSIPEIIFDVQQLLWHCNPSSPAQHEALNAYMLDDKTTYIERIKLQVEKYKPELFLKIASESFPESVGREISRWKLVDRTMGHHVEGQKIIPQTRVPEPPAENSRIAIDEVGGCKCSCCAWGASFYDARDEMRFCFGQGG